VEPHPPQINEKANVMKLLSELKRLVLWIPLSLLCGLSYAKFLYWSSCSQILDPQRVWQRFTQPGHPWIDWMVDHYPPAPVRRWLSGFYARSIDRIAGIAKHYDLSNEFYQLFLDADLFYTCADFLSSTETLEAAQARKASYILSLVEPQPGEKILELGCGWGGLLKRSYERTGDRDNICGYTLSIEQKRWIDQQYGLNVEIKDFVTARFEAESFDKIYSVGAIEHVPQAELLPFSRKLASALKPTGRIVHHFFCQLAEAPPTRLLAAGVEIFPGAELSSLKRHLNSFEQAGLRVVFHSVHDYRPTIKSWFDRLVAHQDRAIQLVGVQTYNLYLCYLAEAWRLFNDRDLMLMRFVLQRQTAPVLWQPSVCLTASS
jgi:cyclopropane-fatty-acyl-phospholipid synthase